MIIYLCLKRFRKERVRFNFFMYGVPMLTQTGHEPGLYDREY